MAKSAISVTLDRDNIAWLQTHARRTQARSLSQAVDDLVTAARTGRDLQTPSRSVVGDVTIAPDDPGLDRADDLVRALFAASVRRAPSGRARKTRRPAHRRTPAGNRG